MGCVGTVLPGPRMFIWVPHLGLVNQAGGQMNEGSWQPQGSLLEMVRKRRVPSRVLWHTCNVWVRKVLML